MEKTVLEFSHVTEKKRLFHKFHLEDISFALKEGYIYALMGKNGAGKSTLLNRIIKEQKDYSGTISFLGKDLKKEHAFAMQRIGFVSEDRGFLEKRTCMQNADILGRLYDDFDITLFRKILKEAGGKPEGTYGKLSRGEKMKFQLAFAAAYHPQLYLFDEADAGMDAVFREEFWKLLQHLVAESCASVLLTSHITSEVMLHADYIGIIEEGRLVHFAESGDYETHRK